MSVETWEIILPDNLNFLKLAYEFYGSRLVVHGRESRTIYGRFRIIHHVCPVDCNRMRQMRLESESKGFATGLCMIHDAGEA